MERGMLIRVVCVVPLTILLGKGALSQNVAAPSTNERPAESALTSSQPQPSVQHGNDTLETLIGGGDLLRISVFGVDDFDAGARVSARRRMSVPLIGDVQDT